MMASMNACSSLVGLVSSRRRWQRPLNSLATPKLRQIDLAWPMCRYPLGSGGKRVTTSVTRPSATSSPTTARMKSRGGAVSGAATLFDAARLADGLVGGGETLQRVNVGGDGAAVRRALHGHLRAPDHSLRH